MTRITACLTLILLTLALSVLDGCTPSEQPSAIIQVCLGDQQNVGTFIDEMKSIARSENMRFIDNSDSTERELLALNQGPKYRLINIGIERDDGMGVTAGNLGLSAHEVALGFTAGKASSTGAQHFADVVVGVLQKSWKIEKVPPGQGAFPMKTCG